MEPVLAQIGFGAVEPLLRAHIETLVQAGTLDAGRAGAWLADLEYAHLAGTFFMATAMMVVAGRKP